MGDHEVRKLCRMSEGGRAGGYNDRQDCQALKEAQVEDGYDDFGRRVEGRSKASDKSERAKAALARLQKRASQRTAAGSPEPNRNQGDGNAGSHADRSRSPRRS